MEKALLKRVIWVLMCTKDNGKMIKNMEKDKRDMRTVICTQDNGKIIKSMEKDI